MATELTLDEEMKKASDGIGAKLQKDREDAIAKQKQPEPVTLAETEEHGDEPKE